MEGSSLAAIARGVLAGGARRQSRKVTRQRSREASWPAARDPRELLLGSIQSQVHVHVRIIKGSLVLSCACRWKRNLKMNEMEKIVRKRVVNDLDGNFAKPIFRVVIMRSLLFGVLKIQFSLLKGQSLL